MSFLSHAATFAGGFVTGFVCYGITKGDDPNEIWETAQKATGNTVSGVSNTAAYAVNGVRDNIISPLRHKFGKKDNIEIVDDFDDFDTEDPSTSTTPEGAPEVEGGTSI